MSVWMPSFGAGRTDHSPVRGPESQIQEPDKPPRNIKLEHQNYKMRWRNEQNQNNVQPQAPAPHHGEH